jgi:sugar lactone lactonase YvrE
MTTAPLHDDTPCLLGEGPLWHPGRGELFWFDILARTLRTATRHWRFDDLVTAAGWVDDDTLMIASDRALIRFTISTGAQEVICPLDADNPDTRSNDGRADPQGGFWIGTMGKTVQDEAGAIWRFSKGEVRKLYPGIRIPNAICFAPNGRTAYFADTMAQVIQRVALDADGWPAGAPQVHVDLRGTDHWPDGAVVAADGTLWNAQWGSYRVAVYDTQGREIAAHALPAAQTSCPAFGGADLSTLYVTSAAAGLPQAQLAAEPFSGCTFALATTTRGQREHRVIL